MQDWSGLRFLVVEDSATMRTWLRNSIIGMGGKQVDVALNYSDALYRISNREPFDVILCDYILAEEKVGNGRVLARDGQHLMEECRQRKLIASSCVFIMVTAERAYEQIFAVAELVPDDYLIKPLTPNTLSERLTRAYEKKQILRPLYDLLDDGEHEKALALARGMAARSTPYLLDCQRAIGECLLKLGRNEEAHRHYQELLIGNPRLPWARMGAARAHFALDRYDESRALLEALIVDNTDYAEAHDLLVEVHEVKGSSEAARALMKEVLARNPRAIHRHREVVRMALDVGDAEDAAAAYDKMFAHGTGSVAIAASDFAGYSTLLMGQGTTKAVEQLNRLVTTLNDHYLRLDSNEDSSRTYKLSEMVAQFSRATASGKKTEAAEIYANIGAHLQEHPVSDNPNRLALMEVAIAAGDETRATKIARSVLADYHGNEAMTQRIIGAMEKGGLGDVAKSLNSESEVAMQNMNRKAVSLAKEGKMEEAMHEFIRLADETRNLSVTFNAALAIVRFFDQGKQDRALLRKLSHYMEVIRNRDGGNPRTQQMIEMAAPHLRGLARL